MNIASINKWVVGLVSVLCLNVTQAQSTDSTCPLKTQSIAIDQGSISYMQGGSGQTVLLLHGLFGQKEQWTEMACALLKQGFNVIVPDLPGYSQSTGYPISIYQLESQVTTLAQFTKALSVKPVHIAGNSMGGAIAALYVNRFPQEVTSLAFIGAPLGVISWSEQVRNAIFRGINPFIPIDNAQLDLEMDLLFAKPPVISEEIKDQLIREYRTNNRHYQQVWDIVNFYGDALNQLPKQTVRTFILWGERDGIFNVSGLKPLIKKFPNSQSHQLPQAGHLVMLEEPSKINDLYAPFLKNAK